MELIRSHRKFRTMPFKPVESRTPISLEFLDKLRIGTPNYKNGEMVMKTDVWNKELEQIEADVHKEKHKEEVESGNWRQ
ncbi:hypothetical protein AK812_SmicGene28392 [Symbiodinium microadriaticum]|uniref:Uncharacterized protein n=1 Tax=Symbiodinium microadriaticum TaxID=2951 RepID=A0A1Q9D4J4_SYMMI|nr:hypothetical protein AK812_SmicGene28392 [Symbiodinium microadriaticum]